MHTIHNRVQILPALDSSVKRVPDLELVIMTLLNLFFIFLLLFLFFEYVLSRKVT